MEKGDYKLAFSTLVYVEVLDSKMPAAAGGKFKQFMTNRETVEVIAVDIRVAEKAQEIRNRTSIGTPDAVHIATAIVMGARLFHTFDERLLKLNEKNEVEGLSVTKCTIPGTSRKMV